MDTYSGCRNAIPNPDPGTYLLSEYIYGNGDKEPPALSHRGYLCVWI